MTWGHVHIVPFDYNVALGNVPGHQEWNKFGYNDDLDNGVENHLGLRPSHPFIIGGREVLYFTGLSDTNDTEASMRFSGVLSD